MRTLRFLVNEQILDKDPSCDFENLVPGSEGYLQAEFVFTPEWNGCAKVAAFYSTMGQEFPPQVLTDGYTCVIPSEACARQTFKVKVIGKKNETKLVTNKLAVSQTGGK